jgi:hypothetical protein
MLLAGLMLSGCNIVRGSGKVVSETREISDFKHVVLNGVGTLYITQGEDVSLEIEAEDNIIDHIESTVRGDRLEIGFEDWRPVFHPTMPIRYYLTAVDLAGFELSGAGQIIVYDITTDDLEVTSSGAGKIDIDSLSADSFTVVLSGAGSCEIDQGEVNSQSVTISGAGGYEALDLISLDTDIHVSGLGSAKIWATETLDVIISGAGNVEYYGQPDISQTISGAGNVHSLGDR